MTYTLSMITPGEVLAQLTLEEKIALLSGDDMWHTAAVPRLGVPRVRCSDGPNGVRGTAWTNGAASSCFPCATGLASSFDVDLARRVGSALGAECRERGVHCLLGPTTNIQRDPRGGRGFESFSEDPLLSGHIAKSWIEGVQSHKVMTTPKHFVGNEQENYRRSNNSVVDLRTLHEIYLEPFRIQRLANPSVYMSSYNRVNGIHVAEDPWLLRQILREEFEFSGMVMSDWSGTYSSSEAIKAGLDLEMPGPAIMRGSSLERDIIGGKLTEKHIDDCVLRVLNYVRESQASGIPFEAPEGTIDSPGVRDLMRETAASGVVLLKNDTNQLPIHTRSGLKVAVIGPNAVSPPYAGGGSASLLPTYIKTPLSAIKDAVHEAGGAVTWALGANNVRFSPLLTNYLRTPGGEIGKGLVLRCDFYAENPFEGKRVKSVFTKANNSAFTYFIDGIPASVPVRGWVSLTSEFVPDESGLWELGLGVAGQADLYVDGVKVIDNSTEQSEGLLFFNTGATEKFGRIEVVAGQIYQLEVRFSNFKQINGMSPYSGRRGGIRLGGSKVRSEQEEIEKAVQLAKDSDVAILVIGTTAEWESEAFDRDDLSLPRLTNELVASVLAAQPSTIIVNQSGMPVEMPWLDQASTVVQAFFGGNECGNGIADTIFGKVNPSAKLPVTWPLLLEDYPSHSDFGQQYETVYSEGLYVGYRYFDRPGGKASAFPFGHGLSYTTFSMSDLSVSNTAFGANVTVKVTNTGSRAGATVVQIYVHACRSPVARPDIELGGFAKVYLKVGECANVDISLGHEAFSYYDVSKGCWIGQKGAYEIRVGHSSRDIVVSTPFHLNQSYHWKGIQTPVIV